MSGDTSPPSGVRLENPARTAGGAASGRQRPSNPSWIKVIGTTIRLWVRRRVLHVPDSGKISKPRRAVFAAVLTVVLLAGAGIAAAVTLPARPSAAGGRGQHAAVRPKLTPAQVAARAAAAATGQANAKSAATWIAAQLADGVVIACDPATCAAILAAGYPSGGQVVLQPGVSLPGPGSLIVASSAVRAEYGAQLASTAPALIASFGTGAEAVQVRLAVPGGPQAYSQAADSALASRRRAGQKLLADRRVHARGAAKADLSSGLVDPRLTTVLRRLAARYSVDVVHFGDAAPLASGTVLAGGTLPFRMAEIVVPAARAGRRNVSELGAIEKLLRKQPAGYRAQLTTHLAGGKHVLEIRFPAPSPF